MSSPPSSNSSQSSEESHSLLESRMPNYSALTLRRSYFVWRNLGENNNFEDVCKYYHRLEAHEATLTTKERRESQQLDLRLATEPPPTTPYFLETFPHVYGLPGSPKHRKPFRPLNILFQLYISSIIGTSMTIKYFCKKFKKNMQSFLEEYNDFSNKCNLDMNLINVRMYMNKKLVAEELAFTAELEESKGALNNVIE